MSAKRRREKAAKRAAFIGQPLRGQGLAIESVRQDVHGLLATMSVPDDLLSQLRDRQVYTPPPPLPGPVRGAVTGVDFSLHPWANPGHDVAADLRKAGLHGMARAIELGDLVGDIVEHGHATIEDKHISASIDYRGRAG